MTTDKINVVGTNIAEKATMIWNVADILRGPFKPHEYGLVILPMTVVKRFHDCLLPTWQQVQDTYEKVKKLAVIEGFLTSASGYQFYNTSKFTFDKLLADPENIEVNFRDYLTGFSGNVQDVLSKFDFDNVIKRMVESNTLYLTIKEFNSPKGYLGADKISAVDCGYIFEDLVRRFSESYNEEAGEHFTSRDIVYLMTDLLIFGANLNHAGSVTVYDMTMGTSQMLSCMEERIRDINPDVEVICFGQEYNPSTFAIAKADMLIRGGDPNNMRFGDTLSEDKFSGYTFQYCISNPPFGDDWKKEQKAVETEHKLGELGRFAPGLPKISDGQQLFVLNGLSKLKPTGKMAIIQNGSPLFAGDAGSGSSEIRRYILENDWLDAIVQLSTDQFMNTGIATYIWICSKDKPADRAGKVQLIDASHCYEPRRKSIGTKRNDITDDCRRLIVQAYAEFKPDSVYGDKAGVHCHSKIFNVEDFGYYKITVERPQLDEHGKPVMKRGKPVADAARRDFENVPMTEDIEEYFRREVLPYAPDAWIDDKKTKVGYEIPMTRYFYEYQPPEPVEDILARVTALEADIATDLQALFDKEG
ncbi:MAG: SAM-dependent DNA methyltransferase [Quinella sp. 3Q1]|nr:SAM-dependent DNA methyltransferase [Quinella sp. 3Q1]